MSKLRDIIDIIRDAASDLAEVVSVSFDTDEPEDYTADREDVTALLEEAKDTIVRVLGDDELEEIEKRRWNRMYTIVTRAIVHGHMWLSTYGHQEGAEADWEFRISPDGKKIAIWEPGHDEWRVIDENSQETYLSPIAMQHCGWTQRFTRLKDDQ